MAKQRLANIGSLTNKLAGLGINYGDNHKQKVSGIFSDNQLKKWAETALINAKMGFGGNPPSGTTGKNLNNPNQLQFKITPPDVLANRAIGTNTDAIQEKSFREVRPGEPSVGTTIPVTKTKSRKRKITPSIGRNPMPLGSPPQQIRANKKAVSPEIKLQKGETENRIYRTGMGFTGWWIKNPESGLWNPEK